MSERSCKFDCEDFSRLFDDEWFSSPKSMNLMSENFEALPDGIIGTSLRLGTFETATRPSKEFLSIARRCETNCKGDLAFDFNLVSPVKYPLGLHYHFHGHVKKYSIDELALSLRRKPPGRTPTNLKAQSDSMGGAPAGFERLMESFNGVKVAGLATMKGHVWDARKWSLKYPVSAKGLDFSPLKFGFQTISLDNANGGQVEFTVFQGTKPFMFEVTSEISIRLDSTCFEQASEQLWNDLRVIFKNDGKALSKGKTARNLKGK